MLLFPLLITVEYCWLIFNIGNGYGMIVVRPVAAIFVQEYGTVRKACNSMISRKK